MPEAIGKDSVIPFKSPMRRTSQIAENQKSRSDGTSRKAYRRGLEDLGGLHLEILHSKNIARTDCFLVGPGITDSSLVHLNQLARLRFEPEQHARSATRADVFERYPRPRNAGDWQSTNFTDLGLVIYKGFRV